jgi:hypothetical protein
MKRFTKLAGFTNGALITKCVIAADNVLDLLICLTFVENALAYCYVCQYNEAMAKTSLFGHHCTVFVSIRCTEFV